MVREEGQPDVPVRATRGDWIDPARAVREFYSCIEPADLRQLASGVEHALVARDRQTNWHWTVTPGVSPMRAGSFTIDRLAWSDNRDIVEQLGPLDQREKPVLLAHVVEWSGFDALRRFTETADTKFFMETEGEPYLGVHVATGGITSEDGRVRYVVIELGPADWRDLVPKARYSLRPRNSVDERRWRVADGVGVTREP